MMTPRSPAGLSVACTVDLDPIIVTAPFVRSGTTLLQRLLCSSANSLIFGENCAQDLELLLGIYTSKMMMYSYYQDKFSGTLERVKRGDIDEWILDLMPDIGGYLQAFGRSCFSGITYCRDYALKMGRPVWGFKCPPWKPQTIHLIREIMPKSRFIYIYRDLVSCVKSAKSKKIVRSNYDFKEFCKAWVDNLTYGHGLDENSTALLVRYEHMVEDPKDTIDRISVFTGAKKTSPRVLEKRINSWRDDISDGYIEPAELSHEEMQSINDIASGLREQLSYSQSNHTTL